MSTSVSCGLYSVSQNILTTAEAGHVLLEVKADAVSVLIHDVSGTIPGTNHKLITLISLRKQPRVHVNNNDADK